MRFKMPNSNNAEFQKWEDVSDYADGVSCHICTGIQQVKAGKIPDRTIDFSIPETVTIGVALWQLCEKCHFDGWIPPVSRFLGKYSYSKHYNGGAKIKVV